MQKDLRNKFNDFFTKEKYEAYKKEIEALSPGNLDFTLAETPLFISKDFTNQMLATCEHVVDTIVNPSFNLQTQRAIPNNANITNEKKYPEFLVFDFGICENEQQQIEPQLIEMQGFPSLFVFQALHSSITFNYANVPNNYSAFLNGYTQETYF
jgi:hypothetical protein